MTTEQPLPPENDPASAETETGGALTISSQDLLQGRRELWIEHEGQLYRLRVTSRGKLYLTK